MFSLALLPGAKFVILEGLFANSSFQRSYGHEKATALAVAFVTDTALFPV
jgi:hypothetical protein